VNYQRGQRGEPKRDDNQLLTPQALQHQENGSTARSTITCYVSFV
jgi:hypothetical protein